MGVLAQKRAALEVAEEEMKINLAALDESGWHQETDLSSSYVPFTTDRSVDVRAAQVRDDLHEEASRRQQRIGAPRSSTTSVWRASSSAVRR
jgi:hypothetical protein